MSEHEQWLVAYEKRQREEKAIRDENERRRSLTLAQQAYEDEYGREAQERQSRLAAEHLPCCGQHRDEGHHEACSLRPAEPTPPIHPGQEALA